MSAIRLTLAALLATEVAWADVYMHNPRGSNDRNCERNVNRNNGDRLFDSQNNNAGGYACPRGVGGVNEDPDTQFIQDENGDYTFTNTTGSYTTNYKMFFYEGSVLPIEFTNQHGCGGNSQLNCEIILQYACEDTLDPQVDNFFPWSAQKNGNTKVNEQAFRYKDTTTGKSYIAAPRDGIPRDSNDDATDNINDNTDDPVPSTVETRRKGMHESYDYYQDCQHTKRNTGLYAADQNINRSDRRGTRQNPNGNRRGFECPEERDYYPWWAPSPWIDIAVLSDSAADTPCYYGSGGLCTTRCVYYLNQSMNYNKKGYCDVNRATQAVSAKLNSNAWNNRQWYNNYQSCVNAVDNNGANLGFKWYMVSHSDNLDLANTNRMVCAKTQYSRMNQLGNAENSNIISANTGSSTADNADAVASVTKSVNANRFQWSIPTIPTVSGSMTQDNYFKAGMDEAYKSCVLRLRYNISTADFQGWDLPAVDEGTAAMVDSRNNTGNNNGKNTPLTQNPYIYIGPGQTQDLGEEFLKLKINTNQFGRTFQDRSYTFTIKRRPSATAKTLGDDSLDVPLIPAVPTAARIFNLNHRGKRGNIVQVYPNVEYDFVPDQLKLNTGDFIHFQWTGSDYNPRRGCNDGAGGPPDANTYNTATNADQNSRADRHNWVRVNHQGFYTPSNYLGYTRSPTATPTTITSADWESKQQNHYNAVLDLAPCNSGSSAADTKWSPGYTQEDCYNTMTRLAYLNQQEDGASLFLRKGAKCYTTTDLAAQADNDVANNHPLNCAKLNAKVSPYFNGGLMPVEATKGWFTYFDSRNNNFSNRMQYGVICVGACPLMNGTNVLQDQNPGTNGNELVNNAFSPCQSNTQAGAGQAVNGVQSCTSIVLTGETFAKNEGDNDSIGDGTGKAGCSKLNYFANGVQTVEQQVVLAIILLFVGLFSAWFSYYLYNRYQARLTGVSKFRFDASWQTADNKELAGSAPKANGWKSGGSDLKKNQDMI